MERERLFCTECGAQLEDFCFSTSAENLEAIRRVHARCKKKGKFDGDLCSKLFIAGPEAPEPPDDETPTQPSRRRRNRRIR